MALIAYALAGTMMVIFAVLVLVVIGQLIERW